jgi:hypothetical protein
VPPTFICRVAGAAEPALVADEGLVAEGGGVDALGRVGREDGGCGEEEEEEEQQVANR